MRNFERKQILAEEAINLINEFREESKIFGEKSFGEVRVSNDFETIEVEDFCDGVLRYKLKEVSNVFKEEIEIKGPYGVHFYNALDEIREEATNNLKNMDKNSFSNIIGKTYYVQYRCEEIYERLKGIEKEVCELK